MRPRRTERELIPWGMFISTFTSDTLVHNNLISRAHLTRALTSKIICFILICHKLEQHSQTVIHGAPGRRRKLTGVLQDISDFRGKHKTLVIKLFRLNYLINGRINLYPTAFPFGNGMVLHFYQQQESSTTKTVHKVINKRLKTYV